MVERANLDPDRLREALEAVDGSRPTQRLVAGIAYANGVTQSELADWFGVERKTIYNWLSRLDSGTVLEAVTDDPRPGRPPKLSADRRAALERTLQDPPTAVGLDAPAWYPQLLQTYLADADGVEYSIPSCRRLLRDAGLTYHRRGAPARSGRPSERDDVRERGAWLPE